MNQDISFLGSVIAFDLDDTLYKEFDFVRSGYKAVASFCTTKKLLPSFSSEQIYDMMLYAFKHGENPFDAVASLLPEQDKDAFIKDAVNIYRSHYPEISLSPGVADMLDALSRNDVRLAMVTDGRSQTQRNKISALGLEKYFRGDLILVSKEVGACKTHPAPWRRLVRTFPNAARFIFVGDNPLKDFDMSAALGFTTIGLRGDMSNIHPQDRGGVKPKLWVESIGSLAETLSSICSEKHPLAQK